MPPLCSVNEAIGNILQASSWIAALTFINILGLNRLLNLVSIKWAKRLFDAKSTYVSDEGNETRGKVVV